MFRLAVRCLFSAVVLTAVTAPAAAQRIAVGVLECRSGPSAGLVVGSVREFNCLYKPAAGPIETYRGVIRRLGLDVGVTDRSVVVWSVFAPTAVVGPGALAGPYAGASAEATIGVGLGANVLVGGVDRSFTLQPLSIEAQQGLNVAVGVASFELFYGR